MHIHLSTVSDMIAAIPALLGFTPSESVVYMPLNRTDSQLHGALLRTEIPREEDIAAYLDFILPIAHRQHSEAVGIVVVSAGDHDNASLPHQRLVTALYDMFQRHEIPVTVQLWVPALVRGARWRCYQHTTCGGTIPDPRSTPLVTELTVRGHVTYSSREELEQQLAPTEEAILRRRSTLLETMLPVSDDDSARRTQVATVRTALSQCVDDGTLPHSDEEIVALASALTDPRVREVALVLSEPRHDLLWRHLVREVPEPEVAEPAVVLAFSTYLRGDGPTASVALDRALHAAPEHRLATLLRHGMHHGVPPEQLSKVLNEIADEVRPWLR